MTNQLAPLVEQVKALRNNIADLDVRIRAGQVLLEMSSEYKELVKLKDDRKNISATLDTVEQGVKESAVAIFRSTQNKAPLPGIVIKIFKTLKYDKSVAEAWAKINLPAVFKFDTVSFEKIAVDAGAPVEVVEEPRAQIASKLE